MRMLAVTLSAALVWGGATTATAGPARQSALRQGAGADTTQRDLAIHVLSRLTYGPRPNDVERVLAMGVDQFIAQQLRPEHIDDSASERRLQSLGVLRTSAAQLSRLATEQRRLRRSRQAMADSALDMMSPAREPRTRETNPLREYLGEFSHLAVLRAVGSERQLFEVMVDFWTNHFNVFLGKSRVRTLAPDYIEHVIRPNALGRFEDLLIATAQAPAMLVYLDNAASVAPGSTPPQLARLERAVQQRRMRGTARRRNGVRGLDRGARGAGAGDQAMTPEQRLERLRGRIPTGVNENYARELLELHTVGVDGGYDQSDIENVARILTGWSVVPQRETFVFNAWAHDTGEKTVMGRHYPAGRGMDEGLELLQWLAAHPTTMRFVSAKLCARFVNDEPPAGCIAAGSAAWQRTGGDIREVVRAIVTSDDFWAADNRKAKIKTPLEFVVSAVRAIDGHPGSDRRLVGLLRRLGQPLYLHEAPTGYPESQEEWVNAGALMNRLNIALALAGGRAPGVRTELDRIIPLDEDHEAMIARVNEVILNGQASASTLDVMRQRTGNIRNPATRRTVLVGLALGGPEFQRQ